MYEVYTGERCEILYSFGRGQIDLALPNSCSGRTLETDDHSQESCEMGLLVLRAEVLACWPHRVSRISYERYAPLAPAVLRVRLGRAREDAVLRHCAGVGLLHEAHQDIRVVLEQRHAPLRSSTGWSIT